MRVNIIQFLNMQNYTQLNFEIEFIILTSNVNMPTLSEFWVLLKGPTITESKSSLIFYFFLKYNNRVETIMIDLVS